MRRCGAIDVEMEYQGGSMALHNFFAVEARGRGDEDASTRQDIGNRLLCMCPGCPMFSGVGASFSDASEVELGKGETEGVMRM